ncbi:MAG: hypothetical protein P4L86_21855 [Mycobacterium sp.]|nr:hypothetical protein [Mycobacterium sp.]
MALTPASTATAWVIDGAPVMAAVLSGTTQLMLSARTDAIAPGQPLTLSATLESYAGPLSGSVALMEGARVVATAGVHSNAASFTITTHVTGIHFYWAVYRGPNGATVRTTPIAVTVGRVSTRLSVSNQKHTVMGGRTAACDPLKSATKPYQPGCEVVYVDWLPSARIAYTLSYADGSSQAFTGTAGGTGHAQKVFVVQYRPPLHAKHGQPVTRAWISVVGTSVDGNQAKSFCLRFAVLSSE